MIKQALTKVAALPLLLGLALSPAIAKDKSNDRRPVENVTDQIDRLQDRLQQDLSADRRDKLEGQIEKLVDKYGITLPPPVDPPAPPEPKELFKDDFNRANTNGAAIGNGWQQSPVGVGVANQALELVAPNNGKTTAINFVNLGGQYESVTMSYDLSALPNSGGARLEVSSSPDGTNYTLLQSHDLSNPNIQDPNNPQHLSWTIPSENLGQDFAWKFEVYGGLTGGGALVDNLTITGEPFAAAAFVGF